eukprot:TRINITY_DN2552_c0_g1_i2.p1 TRINITY_DN2552_c0_g1~~TRINITY_DN2552_c0_g1_i2.p1  ORF type:complete len:594 (-),score=129.17 TRINITY_DN2552_c0_g1_i2:1425-3116(-)
MASMPPPRMIPPPHCATPLPDQSTFGVVLQAHATSAVEPPSPPCKHTPSSTAAAVFPYGANPRSRSPSCSPPACLASPPLSPSTSSFSPPPQRRSPHQADPAFTAPQQVGTPSARDRFTPEQRRFEETRTSAGGSYFLSEFYTLGTIAKSSNRMSASVYKVRSRTTNKKYAVKEIKLQDAASEAEVLKYLHEHPSRHCVDLCCAWTEGGATYIQETLGKKSLAQLFPVDPALFPEATVLSYCRQILLAVEHLHRNRILHLDIKPTNILVKRDGTLMLADFGCSRFCDDTTHRKVKLGSGLYLAAGHLSNGEEVSTATDIFATGVTILEIIYNIRPPEGKAAEALRSLGLKHPELGRKLLQRRHTPTLFRFVAHLLDPDPKRRYSAALALSALPDPTEPHPEKQCDSSMVLSPALRANYAARLAGASAPWPQTPQVVAPFSRVGHGMFTQPIATPAMSCPPPPPFSFLPACSAPLLSGFPVSLAASLDAAEMDCEPLPDSCRTPLAYENGLSLSSLDAVSPSPSSSSPSHTLMFHPLGSPNSSDCDTTPVIKNLLSAFNEMGDH